MADGVAGGPGSRPADQLRGRLRHSAVNDGSGPDRLRRRITLHRSADGAGVPLAAAVAVLPGMPGRDRGTLATLVATAVGLRLPNPSVPAGRHLPVLRSLAADRSPPPRPRADTGSVFPQSRRRLWARSATVRRRPVGRAGATLPPRQRSTESAIDHPGRLPQRVCRLRHLRARPGLGYSTHRRPVGPGRPDTALRPHRGSRRPPTYRPPGQLSACALRTVRRTNRTRPHPSQGPPRRPSPPSLRCASLTCSDPHAAGAQLHWLVSVSRRRGLAVTASNIGWSRHISDALHSAQLCSLSPFLTPSDQLRYRSAAARPTAPDASTDRTRHVPAMLWPNAAFFFAAPAVGIEQLRTALSAAVCLVSARRTLPQVIASLGSATTAPAMSRVLQALRADHRWPAMLAALTGSGGDPRQRYLPDRLRAATRAALRGVPARSAVARGLLGHRDTDGTRTPRAPRAVLDV